MACIEQLPPEVLEYVLCCPELKAADLINCALAAPCFKYVLKNFNIWRSKMRLHYPNVTKIIEETKENVNFEERYTQLCSLSDVLCSNIMALSNVFVWSLYLDYEWPDIPHRSLSLYVCMFDAELGAEIGRYYVLDECYNIIHDGNVNRELTLKYYAKKVYYFVHKSIYMKDFAPLGNCNEKVLGIQEKSAPFSFYKAAYNLATIIPMHERVKTDKLLEVLKQLNSYIDEAILQYRPSLFKSNLRVDYSDTASTNRAGVYSGSDCAFLLKQIHDCVYHKRKWHSRFSSVYGGYRYRLDTVLLTGVGDSRLLVTVEAILCQYYGICFEVHDDGHGKWRICYSGNDGDSGYYQCLTCGSPSETTNFKNAVVTETYYKRSILQTIVDKFEVNLRNEWQLAGGPVVYNLLCEETFVCSMKSIFSAWRYVEHWKIAELRHYTELLSRVSPEESIPGKILHLNILLRVGSNYTLETLTNFRRELVHPPSGIRDLQGIVASVNIRARARLQELKAMLESEQSRKRYFLATFHPSHIRPWPLGWPGSDMVQKRRVDRKSWHVQFAVGQVVQICCKNNCSAICCRLPRNRDKYRSCALQGKTNTNPRSYGSDKMSESSSGSSKSSSSYPTSQLEDSGPIDAADSESAKRENADQDDDDDPVECSEPPRKVIDCKRHAGEPRAASGLCVIYDWDCMCVESEETLQIMGERCLMLGTDQPFYRVLLDNGSCSYVAQETLSHTNHPRPISNPLIGRYFRAFVKPYYIPNMQKAYEYPEDATIREQDAFILSLL
ncbi:Hemimethylated DNA-binding domain [Trinorchestia longiramus]|nr:Hemimethylated DNA-binding domain [Trinorchestia longiramus]